MAIPRLNDVEARVLGVLIEKAFTTPDQYPLSINAIRNGCNQKSNRNPVTDFVEAEVVVGLQGLVPKFFALKVHEVGSRVEKYRHQAQHTLGLQDGEIAILASFLIRGPQAPGELRARVHRMVPTPTLQDLESRLEVLIGKDYVERIAPAPGSRAVRFAQRLGPRAPESDAPASPPQREVPTPTSHPETRAAGESGTAPAARPASLEERVRRLEETVARLLEQLGVEDA